MRNIRGMVLIGTLLVMGLTAARAAPVFPDIAGYRYQKAVEFIASRGIVSGYPDGTFRPDQLVKRSELVKIVLEGNDSTLVPVDCFTDVASGMWYAKYACRARDLGIVQGYPDGSFGGDRDVNFVEALKILQLAYDVRFSVEGGGPWFKGIVDSASTMNIIPRDTYAFDQKVTRGQMAEILTRLIKHREGTLEAYLKDDRVFQMTYSTIEARQTNLTEEEWLAQWGPLARADQPDAVENFYVHPLRLIPFASKEDSRQRICVLKPGGPIEEICSAHYDNLTDADESKIDELLVILRAVQEDGAASEQAKYLTSILVFSTLPGELQSISHPPMSIQDSAALFPLPRGALLASAETDALFSGQADFEAQLREDIRNVSDNCPQAGYENWVFTAMCSRQVWQNNEQLPRESTQYAEAGGPCVWDEAGAIEAYRVHSITGTKMRSEKNFIDGSGLSTQIACEFSCGSFHCPALEQKVAEKTYCENPVYYPHRGVDWIGRVPANIRAQAYENMEGECEERGYDYPLEYDGSVGRVKVMDCHLLSGKGADVFHDDPPDYTPMVLQAECCSCERPANRDSYASSYDFSDPDYTGSSLLQDLLQSLFNRDDARSSSSSTPTRLPASSSSEPASSSSEAASSSSSEESLPRCCEACPSTDEFRFYIPFEGDGCRPGDARRDDLSLEQCVNPFIERPSDMPPTRGEHCP